MNELRERIQAELLTHYNNEFYIFVYGCGGVIFRQHFLKLLDSSNGLEIIRTMEEYNLVKQKQIGKNYVLIVRHATLRSFGLQNKSVRLTSARLLHSALFCEVMLHTYGSGECDKMRRLLSLSNFAYFAPRNSVNILGRIFSYLESRNVDGLGVLQGSIAELEKKTRFIESSYQGRSESMGETSSLDDLLTLRNNDVYIKSINAVGDSIVLNVALFATNKRAEKICDAVCKTESTIASTFGNIKLAYRIHVYSLAHKSEATEKRVKNRLLSVQGNATKADFYDSILFFHWYDKKNTLFSGIEIERWL